MATHGPFNTELVKKNERIKVEPVKIEVNTIPNNEHFLILNKCVMHSLPPVQPANRDI